MKKSKMEKLIITPKTKIYDLLEAYPDLETALIEMAPPFKKLKNPILRKTITKITTLNQAATIAGLKVEELINRLRELAGQGKTDVFAEDNDNYTTVQPDWFEKTKIAHSLDIRLMLNEGEQPVHEVLSQLKKLNNDEVLELIAPFIPAPLIDKSMSLGYRHWIDERGDELFYVYFSQQLK